MAYKFMRIDSLDHKLIKLPSHEKIEGALIFLHGYGSNGYDMMGLSHYFTESLPNYAYICPNAPTPCEASAFGFQWFSLKERSLTAMIQGVQSTTYVKELVQDVTKKWNISSSKIALMGFSQGCMTALYHGLCGEIIFGAIAGFSGRAIINEQVPIIHRPPVLIIHGGEDNIVPTNAFTNTIEIFNEQKVGYEALFRPHLAHSIDETGLHTTTRFLKRVLKA